MNIPVRNLRPARITLNIDKLVLRGIAPGDRPHLIGALRNQLEQVLSDPATRAEWAKSSRAPVLQLGEIAFMPGSSGSRKLGQAIGKSIGENISGNSTGRRQQP